MKACQQPVLLNDGQHGDGLRGFMQNWSYSPVRWGCTTDSFIQIILQLVAFFMFLFDEAWDTSRKSSGCPSWRAVAPLPAGWNQPRRCRGDSASINKTSTRIATGTTARSADTSSVMVAREQEPSIATCAETGSSRLSGRPMPDGRASTSMMSELIEPWLSASNKLSTMKCWRILIMFASSWLPNAARKALGPIQAAVMGIVAYVTTTFSPERAECAFGIFDLQTWKGCETLQRSSRPEKQSEGLEVHNRLEKE